jgi:hypothetical protein
MNNASAIVESILDRAVTQFESAASREGVRSYAWRVGRSTIEQRHLGSHLEDLMLPAWAHLPVAPIAAADLTVYCADVAATGLDLGALPWRVRDTANQGLVDGLAETGCRALWDRQGRAVHLIDCQRGIALYAVASRQDFRSWERSLPLRHILHWWTAAKGGQLIHAGAVGTSRGGALVLGASGAGKSTTSLACLDGGLAIAGDDFVLVEPGGGTRIHSVSSTAKLSHEALRRFPQLQTKMANPDEGEPEKFLFFLDRFHPSPLIQSMPLKALLMLRRGTGGDSRIVATSAGAALQASAPNTLFLLPGDRAQAFAKIARIFREHPCFRIDLGDDLRQIPMRIGELLDRL